MKLRKYDNLTSKVHKFTWNKSADTYLNKLYPEQSDARLIAQYNTQLSQKGNKNAIIMSPQLMEIIQKMAQKSSACVDFVPDEIIAPIGPITVEHIVNHTAVIQESVFKRHNTSKPYLFGQSSHNMPWHTMDSWNLVHSVVSNVIPRTKNGKSMYLHGITLSIKHMMKERWDERTLYLFMALNRFLGDESTGDTVFNDYLKTQTKSLDEEFSTFSGSENNYTLALSEVWSTDFPLLPRGDNALKTMKVLGTLTHEKMVQLVTSGMQSYRIGHHTLTKSNQVELLKEVALDIVGNVKMLTAGVAGDLCTEAYLLASNDETSRASSLLGIFSESIVEYQREHLENDLSSSAFAQFIFDNAEKFTKSEITALVTAVSHPELMMTNGKSINAKSVLYTMVTDSRDPVTSLKFVAETILHYDDSLPTKKMWLDLVDRDKEMNELDSPSGIVLRISGASSQRRMTVYADGFRKRMRNALKPR